MSVFEELFKNFNFKGYLLEFEYSPVKLEYLTLLLYLVFAIILAVAIILASYFLAKQNPDSEKISAYECGFEPYDDTRHAFNVKFCVVAILFIVFDIEIMFLVPWCVSVAKLNLLSYWSMMDFLIELIIGLFYVWTSGALDWED
jgi:NADH-quinone oxidoreductase subunit A